MLLNLSIVLPIFALVLVGWVAGKYGAIGPAGIREVNRLVVYLALPALLFDIMANAEWDEIWRPDFVLAYGGGCIIIYLAIVYVRRLQGLHLADASIDGLNASYANSGYVGFPLIFAVLGATGLPLTLVAAIMTVCVLFAVAIIVIEVSLQQEADLLIIMKKTGISLAKNPLLIAPVLGALFMATGLNMPGPIDRFLELLGNAAAPCALVALGLFLAGTDIKNGIEKPVTLSMLVFYKLAVQPAVTWVIAVPILGMDPMASFVVVILSALPTGTGPFMLAVTYERDARMTGQAILISTCLSVVSISVLMAILPL